MKLRRRDDAFATRDGAEVGTHLARPEPDQEMDPESRERPDR